MPRENLELVLPAGKGGNVSFQREEMEMDPTSGKRLPNLASGKTWNRSLLEEKDRIGFCQGENLELVPGKLGTGSSHQETWNWILPAGKYGIGHCQGENLELVLPV